MPNGDAIKPGVSFLDIRSFYKNDPDWPKVQAYLDGGAAPIVQLPPVLGPVRRGDGLRGLRPAVPERLIRHSSDSLGKF